MPRKPIIIHFFYNHLIQKSKIIMYAFIFIFFIGFSTDIILDSLTTMYVYTIIIMLLMSVCLFYVWYWSIPSYIEWKRNRKVFQTANTYRKPPKNIFIKEYIGETVSWQPRLIVDDTPYYLIDYYFREVSVNGGKPGSYVVGYLGLDLQGNIIRDQEITHKLIRCQHLGYRSSPLRCIDRSNEYKRIIAALKMTEKYIRKFDAIRENLAQLLPEGVCELEAVFRGFTVIHDRAIIQRNVLLEEAKYVEANPPTKMRECRYEDVLIITQKLRDILSPTPAQETPFLEGLKARQRLLLSFKKANTKVPRPLRIILLSLKLNEVEYRKMFDSFHVPAYTDELAPIYSGLTEDALRVWKERLEYADSIDKRTI